LISAQFAICRLWASVLWQAGVVGLLIPILLILSGCTPPALPVEIAWPHWWPFAEEAPPPTAPQTPAQAAPLTFVTWTVSRAEEEFLRTQLEEFAVQNPGPPLALEITGDYDRRIQEPTADEQAPDLFLVTGFALPTLIAANLLAPVPDQYDQTQEIVPALRSGFASGAATFCLPREAHTLALAYNPALFDRAETPHPTAAWTWGDLAAAAEAVNDQDFFLFAFTLNPDLSRIAPFMLQAGGDWVQPATGVPTFDAPQSQTGMAFFIDLFRAGHAVYDTTLDGIWPGEAFGRGSAGMAIEGSWLLPFLAQDFPRFEYGVTELPAGPAGRATLAFTTCLGVNPNSPHRERAYALAAHLTRADVASAWREYTGGMPLRPDELHAWQAVDPRRQPFVAGLAYARVWQFPLSWQHIPESATPLIRSVIAGEHTVETLAQRLQAAAQGEN
jgi:multiple sugar transport system substrate-binding protein